MAGRGSFAACGAGVLRLWGGLAMILVRSFRRHSMSLGGALFLALLLVQGPVRAQDSGGDGGDLTLSLIHTNDFHARIEPVTVDGSRCRPVDAQAHRCYGGIARLLAEANRLRATNPNPLLLDAGDRFQGSLFYHYYKSAALKPFFALGRYQAMIPGNHEFDDGPEEFGRFLDGLGIPVLGANLDVKDEPSLAGRLPASVVLNVGGRRVGVIGVTTPSTASSAKPGPNVHFTDPVAAVRREVAALQEKGVRHILVLSHLGFGEDQRMAASVDGVSVIMGGHTHTLLREGDPRAAGSSPRVVDGPGGRPVLVAQAYFGGIYLGFLQVTLDSQGVPKSWKGNPVLLDDSLPEDPVAASFVNALATPLRALLNARLGDAAGPLQGARSVCRFAECSLGNVVADAMVAQTRSVGVQVAIVNGGAIRASIPAGPITEGQVLEVMPFANTIDTMSLKGEHLRAALEHGVSQAENADNSGTGRFPQVSGMRYSWDAGAPVGRRIIAVHIRQPDGRYAELDPNAIYRIATVDYLHAGGDGYAAFQEHGIDSVDSGFLLSDALADYLKTHSPVVPVEEGRIIRLR